MLSLWPENYIMIGNLYFYSIPSQNMGLLIYKGLFITVGTIRCLYQGAEVNTLRHWWIWTCSRSLCASDSRVLYRWHYAPPHSLSPTIELWGELPELTVFSAYTMNLVVDLYSSTLDILFSKYMWTQLITSTTLFVGFFLKKKNHGGMFFL